MAKPKTIERGMLSGTGATITEAKADLNTKIDAALDGSYAPRIVAYKGVSALVYREPDGWYYRLLHPDTIRDGVNGAIYGTHYGSRAQAENEAAHHVLNAGPDAESFYVDEDVPSFLTDRGKREDLITAARFYRACRWARENMPEIANDTNTLHRWACEHSSDPQFANRPVPNGWDAIEPHAHNAMTAETLLSAIF